MSHSLNTVPAARRVVMTNELVTGPPAAEMLRRSSITLASDTEVRVLDNATGGGILVAELFKQIPNSLAVGRILAGDIDEQVLHYSSMRKEESVDAEPRWRRVELMKIDQQAIRQPDAAFSHVFSNFGVIFCKDDEAAVKETFRVLQSGGVAGFTSWKAISWWTSIAVPALAASIPDAPLLPDPSNLFPAPAWTDPTAISATLGRGGFSDIQIAEYSFTPDVPAEEFAEATALLVKVVANKAWSADEYAKYADRVQPALLSYLMEKYEGGRWDGKMTAVISFGRKS